MKSLSSVLLVGALALGSQPVLADEFSETLETAMTAYKDGDLAQTSEELAYATQLLNQKRVELLSSFLPKSMEGWENRKSKRNAGGGGIFGGGLSAQARFRRGRDRISVQIMADSPLVASMAMLMKNPTLAGANGKVKRINGQKILIKGNGELQALVKDRIVIQISGKAPAEDFMAFFKAIDLKGLKKF